MDTVDWLMAGDPSIRWQVMADLLDADPGEIAAERRRVGREGWGAALLERQDSDGLWRVDDEPDWVPNFYTMLALRDLGVDPADPVVGTAVDRMVDTYRWPDEFGARRFFGGEVEECINGRVLGLGVYFDRIDADLVDMLLGQQLADGGWNCYAPPSAVGSFASTICVIEGLAAFERARGPVPAVGDARRRGEEYLLSRRLFRRLTDGTVAADDILRSVFPPGWHYDLLRGLEYFRTFGDGRDERLGEAVQIVRDRADMDGRWMLDRRPQFDILDTGEAVGEPSRWVTLRAMRVMRWWDGEGP